VGLEPTIPFREKAYETSAIAAPLTTVFFVGILGLEPRLYPYQRYILTNLDDTPIFEAMVGFEPTILHFCRMFP
jgi:hypothetical protein